MGRVSWSDQAVADLASIDHAVVDQLLRNAEEILHDIPPVEYEGDEGELPYGIMWRRAITYEQKRQVEAGELPDSPPVWDYVLLYTKQRTGQGFEVLAVLSNRQIANMWVQRTRELSDADVTDIQSP